MILFPKLQNLFLKFRKVWFWINWFERLFTHIFLNSQKPACFFSPCTSRAFFNLESLNIRHFGNRGDGSINRTESFPTNLSITETCPSLSGRSLSVPKSKHTITSLSFFTASEM